MHAPSMCSFLNCNQLPWPCHTQYVPDDSTFVETKVSLDALLTSASLTCQYDRQPDRGLVRLRIEPLLRKVSYFSIHHVQATPTESAVTIYILL